MSVAPNPDLEFSFPVDATQVPPAGRQFRISADAEQRARVAMRLGVEHVDRLDAQFELKPRAGGIVKVTGAVQAALTQACVVSLAPLPVTVNEDVEITFTTRAAPEPKAGKKEKDGDTREEVVSLEHEDPPEAAPEGIIDLGELAVTQMALGLDPYPRAPGVAFDSATWGGVGKNVKPDNPFAVLAQLKQKPKT